MNSYDVLIGTLATVSLLGIAATLTVAAFLHSTVAGFLVLFVSLLVLDIIIAISVSRGENRSNE